MSPQRRPLSLAKSPCQPCRITKSPRAASRAVGRPTLHRSTVSAWLPRPSSLSRTALLALGTFVGLTTAQSGAAPGEFGLAEGPVLDVGYVQDMSLARYLALGNVCDMFRASIQTSSGEDFDALRYVCRRFANQAANAVQARLVHRGATEDVWDHILVLGQNFREWVGGKMDLFALDERGLEQLPAIKGVLESINPSETTKTGLGSLFPLGGEVQAHVLTGTLHLAAFLAITKMAIKIWKGRVKAGHQLKRDPARYPRGRDGRFVKRLTIARRPESGRRRMGR